MIYLDHHATTPCAPEVVQAMLPWLVDRFGNPHSNHALGREAAAAVDTSIENIARLIGAPAESIIVTSGATESNNLAIQGVCRHPRQKRRQLISAQTEHPAVLDVLTELQRDGFDVTLLDVNPEGQIDLDQLSDSISDETALVSVMWANNEIGSIAPIDQIAEICHRQGTLLHSDASQVLGRIDIDIVGSDVDLVSFSGHKVYGPKGVGLLVAGNGNRRVRLRPQIVGGGQQRGRRSGTLNPAAIVGLQTAIQLADQNVSYEQNQTKLLRDRLWEELSDQIDGLQVNGAPLDSQQRLAGNLNISAPRIEGDAWLSATPKVAFSTGSACSSADEAPSHVLRSIGLSESAARRSVRFGVGRGNDEQQILMAASGLVESYQRLIRL